MSENFFKAAWHGRLTIWAIQNQHHRFLSWFRKRLDFSATDEEGSTVLHYVAVLNDTTTLGIMFPPDRSEPIEGIDLKAKNTFGDTALHSALKLSLQNTLAPVGSDDTIRFLAQKLGKSVNIANEAGQTPLHLAASMGKARLLFEANRHVNVVVTDKQGNTPLHISAVFGDVSELKSIKQLGGDDPSKGFSNPNNRYNNRSETPLHVAAAHGREDAMVYLVDTFYLDVDALSGESIETRTILPIDALAHSQFAKDNTSGAIRCAMHMLARMREQTKIKDKRKTFCRHISVGSLFKGLMAWKNTIMSSQTLVGLSAFALVVIPEVRASRALAR